MSECFAAHVDGAATRDQQQPLDAWISLDDLDEPLSPFGR
jgi:hypothetical protein